MSNAVRVSVFFLMGLSVRPQTAGRLDPSWVRHVIVEDFHSFTGVAGDFTGDGRIDVIANGGAQKEDVLFVAPDWKRVVLHRGIQCIHSAILDVNADGAPDFVCARYSPGMIYWLEHPKNALTDPWVFHVLDERIEGGLDGIHGLTVGDVNGDGKLDLVANSGGPEGSFPNSLAWFEAPTWKRQILANGDAPGTSHYVALGDINGDGRPDVATAAKFGNWFGWWEAPKNRREAWKKHIVAENQEGATNIMIRDMNGDGSTDLVASRGHGKGLVWFQAPDWKPHEFGANLNGPHSLDIGDLNGDGKVDVATCAKDSKILAWFEGDGKGNLVEHVIYDDQAGYDVRLIDMDGDGDLDIVVAGQDSKNVVWYENRLRGQHEPAKKRTSTTK